MKEGRRPLVCEIWRLKKRTMMEERIEFLLVEAIGIIVRFRELAELPEPVGE
jgi:hypothetical protein